MRLTQFSVRNYQFTTIIFVLVTLLGLNALFNMPRGEDPPFGAPIFVVVAVYPGASPDDIEQLVADPLEEALYKLEDVKKLVTVCDDGLMIMRLEFNFNIDVEAKNNDVIREINRIRPDLPAGLLELRSLRAASSDVAILQTALVSETASDSLMAELGDKLKQQLEKLTALKAVEVQGERREEIRIELDLQRMTQFRLGLNQVLQTIGAANINIPGGDVDLGSRKFNIKTTSDYRSVAEIGQTIVRTTAQGNVVHLSDIATVRATSQEAVHLARQNGKRAIWVVSSLKDRKNIIQTREKMTAVLSDFEKRLPPDIKMVQAFDQAQSVNKRLGGLGRDFLIAIGLVMLTLLPLGWRASLVVMISIPLSLSIGLTLLNLAGFTLNQLSIVGLVVALGLLVDDSIVVVENIERFLRMGYSKREAAVAAVNQIGVAIIGCTAVLILAFLPLCFLPEGSGEFIRSLPMGVLVTVFASLFVALTIIPFLSSIMLKPHTSAGDEGNFFLRAFKKYINKPYQKVLLWAFKHPIWTLLSVALVFAGSILLMGRLGFALFPIADKPLFNVNIEMPVGTNLLATDKMTRGVERLLLAHPNIEGVSANVGKGNPRVYYNQFQRDNSTNYAQLLVKTTDHLSEPALAALADELREKLDVVAGAKIEVERFAQGPPVNAPIEFLIIGDNTDTLRLLANQVEAIFKATAGTRYVRNDLRLNKTDLLVDINKEKAGLLGIPTSEVARTVRMAIAGLNAGIYRTSNGDKLEMRVLLPQNEVNALKTFDQINITSLSGALVPLRQIAEVKLAGSPSLVRHYNKERYTLITAFNQTGYNTAALTDALQKKMKNINFPNGYNLVIAGERESRDDSFGGMGTIILLSVFGLLAILVLEFRTFKSTLIVLSVVPMGIIGAVLTLWLVGEPLSFIAVVGMIALIGIEIKNSILLVDYTNQLREQGMGLHEAILDGADTRFLPILLTSLTAIGGLIPLVLENSTLISPLAWVLIGGLISSTLLSRIVTPLVYLLIPPKITVKEKE